MSREAEVPGYNQGLYLPHISPVSPLYLPHQVNKEVPGYSQGHGVQGLLAMLRDRSTRAGALHPPCTSPASRLHLPCISPASPVQLPFISPSSPLYLAYISPTSRLYLPCISLRLLALLRDRAPDPDPDPWP